MDDFLAVVGGFSLILCAVIVLLFPVLLAFLLSPAWLWMYILYLVGFGFYIYLIISIKREAAEKATQKDRRPDR